jgi:DNA-binding transcriptional LysR family regulator
MGVRVEIGQLKVFRAVARRRSFTRAAEELGYAQSSVTARVKSLERELGVALFDRLGRGIALTEAGRRLLGHAEALLELEERAKIEVKGGGEPSGTLRVSAPETLTTYRLPPVLASFRERYPSVKLVFYPNPTGTLDRRLERDLREGVVDIAFVIEEPERVTGPDFLAETLAVEHLALVGPPDHPLARAGTVTPHELSQETMLLTEKGCGYRNVFERGLEHSGVRLDLAVEFASGEAIKRCVASGMGLAVLSEISVGREIERGEFVRLAWPSDGFSVESRVVYHRDKWISPAILSFLKTARHVLRSEGDQEARPGVLKAGSRQ